MVPSEAETVTREFTIVVEASTADVWHALTSPDYITEWWFANTVESTWEVGAPITRLDEGGLPEVVGAVLAFSPPEHLATSLRPVWSAEIREEPETRVDWRLEEVDGAADSESTRVTLTHSGVRAGGILDRETAPGWSYLLESLKVLLER